MRLDTRWFRGTLIVLGVAALAASLASPAAADHGRRYKGQGGDRGARVVQHVHATPGWGFAYSSRGSRGAPALASFIGGLVLGNALAHATTTPRAYCPPAAADYYFDPYCHERFSSLEAYGDHLDNCCHPAWVQVIDGNSDRCVGESYWQDGRWRNRGDSRDYGDRGEYGDDRGGYDDRGGDWKR